MEGEREMEGKGTWGGMTSVGGDRGEGRNGRDMYM